MKHNAQEVRQLKKGRSLYFKAATSAYTIDESDKVFGYLSAFGNRDSDGDVVLKGAFSKSIQERGPDSKTPRKIAYLYAHDMCTPIGRFTKLEEQTEGLYYEAELDVIPFVQETIKPQMKSGTLNNHSIGYNYVWDKCVVTYDEEDNPTFTWAELDLHEGSILPLGANPDTPFGGFKHYLEQTEAFAEMAEKADRLLRKMGNRESEYELRNILQKYQSLMDMAADEITAMRNQPRPIDYKYMIENFKL